MIAAIEASKQVPFERVLYALGIRFVGKVVAKTLAKHFKSMNALQHASIDSMLQIDGVGEAIASSVRTFMLNETNQQLVERLAQAGLQMECVEASKASDTLQGLSIVISGTFAKHSRDEYKQIIEAHGGKNVGSISKKTSFVLAGEGVGPSKLEKATTLGIKLVNEDEFLQMIGEA